LIVKSIDFYSPFFMKVFLLLFFLIPW
jgi:hypothetical protein